MILYKLPEALLTSSKAFFITKNKLLKNETMYYTNETTLFLDGKWLKATGATTDLYSQTMHYGAGVFEGTT